MATQYAMFIHIVNNIEKMFTEAKWKMSGLPTNGYIVYTFNSQADVRGQSPGT